VYEGLSLLDFIPAISPEHRSPYHLADWCDLIEHSLDCYRKPAIAPMRAMCTIPIRHWKTWTTIHGLVWLLIQDPTLRIIYLTHEHQRANEIGKDTRQVSAAADVGPTRGWDTISNWRNKDGGGVLVMSADQSKLGQDCHVLIFDDPIDEHSAFVAETRENVDRAINHYTMRCQRNGKRGPVLGVGSRWHTDDPFGRRKLRKGWLEIEHPVIVDEHTETERAFAPDVMGLDEIKAIRAEQYESDPTERNFQAQYMGNPRPVGGERFRTPARYLERPHWPGFRIAMGVDLAYTMGSQSDWFALVTACLYGSQAFLLNVQRQKTDFNSFEAMIRADWAVYGTCPIFTYMSGPEKGVARYFHDRGVPIQPMPARFDKSTRAQKTIDLWNTGRVLVPVDAPWVPAFLSRVQGFTGRPQEGNDDEIDALVSLVDGMMLGGGTSVVPTVFGSRRFG
jgi:predicted phage terminase large subunit-like protein